jgi:hypothetical protein
MKAQVYVQAFPGPGREDPDFEMMAAPIRYGSEMVGSFIIGTVTA